MEFNLLLEVIDGAGERELNDAVMRILKRYTVLFPEEEVIFLSLPRNDLAERRRILGDLYVRMTDRAE